MSIEIRDTITPSLRKLASKISDKKPLLEAMGQAVLSITKHAFDHSALRIKE